MSTNCYKQIDTLSQEAGPRELARVLVADQDPITRRLLNSICEREGYQLVGAKDGREAYRRLQSDSDFKVAVFDMSMPYMDGLEIVRYMKTEKRLMRIPIVVVADEYGLKHIPEYFAAGAVAFLPKPFTLEQLRRTLRMVISRFPKADPSRLH